ncbi:MAG: M23 family metallopeptidase [Myxococcota bacterium]|jgi:murein DD-endopeptidase MepM/ murein hydrolase activator NlpD
MGLLDAADALRAAGDPRREAAKALEALVLKQLIGASGAFKGGDAAGSQVWADVFAEAVAEAVAGSGGLGLGAALAASLPAPPSGTPGDVLPGGGVLTSGFGERVDPFTHQTRRHDGVDLAAPEGTPILSVADGVVLSAGPRGGYGNAVEVAHPDGTTSLYAHAREVTVSAGQPVRAGDVLAHVGRTGRSTGNHLHFELRRGGHAVDPRLALKRYGARADTSGAEPPGEESP